MEPFLKVNTLDRIKKFQSNLTGENMKLAIAALTIGLAVGAIYDTASAKEKPKQEPKATTPAPVTPAQTFDQKYFAQVDRTNAALQVYGNTSCTNISFKDVEEQAKTEYNALVDLYHNIPDEELEITRAKQVEVMIGVSKIAQDLIDVQAECFEKQEKSTPTEPKENPEIDQKAHNASRI
jgi:hypothetical protein